MRMTRCDSLIFSNTATTSSTSHALLQCDLAVPRTQSCWGSAPSPEGGQACDCRGGDTMWLLRQGWKRPSASTRAPGTPALRGAAIVEEANHPETTGRRGHGEVRGQAPCHRPVTTASPSEAAGTSGPAEPSDDCSPSRHLMQLRWEDPTHRVPPTSSVTKPWAK